MLVLLLEYALVFGWSEMHNSHIKHSRIILRPLTWISGKRKGKKASAFKKLFQLLSFFKWKKFDIIHLTHNIKKSNHPFLAQNWIWSTYIFFLYWICNSMNNLSSYFGLIISASDKNLSVSSTLQMFTGKRQIN